MVPVPGVGGIPLLNAVTYKRPVLTRRGLRNRIAVPRGVGTSFTLHYGNSSVVSTHVGSNSVICVHRRPGIGGNRVTTILVSSRTALGEICFSGSVLALVPYGTGCRPFVFSNITLRSVGVLNGTINFADYSVWMGSFWGNFGGFLLVSHLSFCCGGLCLRGCSGGCYVVWGVRSQQRGFWDYILFKC